MGKRNVASRKTDKSPSLSNKSQLLKIASRARDLNFILEESLGKILKSISRTTTQTLLFSDWPILFFEYS